MKSYSKALSFLVKLVSLPLKVGSDNPKKVEFQVACSLLPYLYGYNKATISALYKQAWVETGDFKSALFQHYNNAFGMRVPNVREWLGTGSHDTATKGTFSIYSSVTCSLLDRILLDKYNNVNRNTGFDNYLQEVIYIKNYLPEYERNDYWVNITENAPAFNFFFKAIISVICTTIGVYYITNRLFG
jgi:hypothetical protein